jgi:NTP pyrophosphatase (non-canonical NTP hydrolase)
MTDQPTPSHLDFATLRAANMSRVLRWHPGGLAEWSLSDWATAAAGEMGEACNVVKKLNRVRDGLTGNGDTAVAELDEQLGDEIADVVIYLDLMAASKGIDLAQAIARKFNKTSVKVGFPERLIEPGRCRVCGCTDDAACILPERSGELCDWADDLHTLCDSPECLAAAEAA